MFENFPKTRTTLPEKFQRLYSQQYEKNRKGETPAASLAQRVESWLHKQVARHGIARDGAPLATLELGAGTLNQLAYEAPSPAYDIVEPFTSLFERSPVGFALTEFKSRRFLQVNDAFLEPSGFTREEEPAVLAAFPRLVTVDRAQEDEWVCVTLQRDTAFQ